jgi:hypothetical protein
MRQMRAVRCSLRPQAEPACGSGTRREQTAPRNTRAEQDLRSARSPNCHRISRIINTSYAVGSKPGICRDKRPDSPPAGRNGTFFFQKIWLGEPNFLEKDTKVPCCRRRVWPPSGEMSGLYAHRVTPVINTSYAVPDLQGHVASGRAEET